MSLSNNREDCDTGRDDGDSNKSQIFTPESAEESSVGNIMIRFRQFDNYDSDFSAYGVAVRRKVIRRTVKEDDRVPHGFVLPSLKLPVESSYRVRLSHFLTTNDFYLQMQDKKNELLKMISDIQKDYMNKYSYRYFPEKGAMVVAKCKHDKLFHRGEVISSLPTKIQFVDTGRVDVFEPYCHDVYPLMKKFATLPRQAFHCKLDDIDQLIERKWVRGIKNTLLSLTTDFICTIKLLVSPDYFVVQLNIGNENVPDQLMSLSECSELIPETDELDGPKLKTGDLVLISHADTADAVYLNKVCDTFLIDKIESALTKEKEIDFFVEGTLFGAKLVDNGGWYRGIPLPHNQVYLIDLGKLVPKSGIKKLPAEFVNIPPLAYKCSVTFPQNIKLLAQNQKHIQFEVSEVKIINNFPHVKLSIWDEENGDENIANC